MSDKAKDLFQAFKAGKLSRRELMLRRRQARELRRQPPISC